MLRNTLLSLLLLVVTAGWCSPADLRIAAPDTALTGDLVLLRIDSDKPPSKVVWAVCGPSEDTWVAVENGTACIFANRRPGKYSFFAAVLVDSELTMLRHDLVLSNDDNPQPNPNPEPQPDLTKWAEVARAKAIELVPEPRKVEALKLADAIEKATQTSVDSLRKARETMRQTNREALGVAYVRWLEWSDAIGDELEKKASEIVDVSAYNQIMKQIAEGLRNVPDDEVKTATTQRSNQCANGNCQQYPTRYRWW